MKQYKLSDKFKIGESPANPSSPFTPQQYGGPKYFQSKNDAIQNKFSEPKPNFRQNDAIQKRFAQDPKPPVQDDVFYDDYVNKEPIVIQRSESFQNIYLPSQQQQIEVNKGVDQRILSKPNITNKTHRQPIILLSLFNLGVSFILNFMIFVDLNIQQQYSQVDVAEQIISFYQKENAKASFASIKSIPASENCDPPFTTATLGVFPGTNKGCICPDMTTSSQGCYYPCQILDSKAQMKYKVFDNTKICVITGTTLALNVIKPGQAERNYIALKDQTYALSADSELNQTEIYSFKIQPSYPCINNNLAPLKKSELSYPFNLIPNSGCDEFGVKILTSIPLGTVKQKDLFQQNKISNETTQLPFFNRYFDGEDDMTLFIIRKHYLNPHPNCQEYLKYPYRNSYNQCLLLQTLLLIQFYFAMIFLILSVFFYFYGRQRKIEKLKYPKEAIKPPKRKFRAQQICFIQYPKALKKSIIIFGIAFVVIVVLNFLVYLYCQYNTEGLFMTSEIAQFQLTTPCYQSEGINNALLKIQYMCESCTAAINGKVWCLVIFNLLILTAGIIFSINKNKGGAKKSQ